MADPLNLLREFNIKKKTILEDEKYVIFGEYAWPKDCKTNYKVWRNLENDDSPSSYYDLGSLYYFLQKIDLAHPLYVRNTRANKIAPVRLPDRKELLAFLNGEVDTTASIDKSMPVDFSLRKSAASLDRDHTQIPVDDSSENVLDSIALKPKRAKIVLDDNIGQFSNFSTVQQENIQPNKQEGTSISEAIPLDRLQALRAKILAKKRQTISSTEIPVNEEGDGSNHIDNLVREITSRERVWTTRINVLDSGGKEFLDHIVNGVLRTIKTREEGKFTQSYKLPESHAAQPSSSLVNIGYSRYEQERFATGQEDTAGFKIDTMGTYHGGGIMNFATSKGKELPSQSVTVSRTGVPNDPRNRDPRQQSHTDSRSPGYKPVQDVKRRSQVSAKHRTPIIIIPAAPTSLITTYNSMEILQNLHFVSSDEMRKKNSAREAEIIIQHRKSDGTTAPYRVTDQPMKLNAEEWDRVVAVYVQGPAWQFKGWPLGSDPAVIFSKIKAFHLHWSRLPLHENIKNWNCTVIQLDERRHLDNANLQQFWESLEKFIRKAKPHLRF